MNQTIKRIAIFLLVLSAIGFIDASYLTIEHYRGVIPPCTTDGCEIVLTSEYSKIAGIPVALFGALYYLTMLIVMIASLDRKKELWVKYASFLTPLGFIFSVYFVYLQIFVIKSICQYCMVSALTSTLLFVGGMWAILIMRKQGMLSPLNEGYIK